MPDPHCPVGAALLWDLDNVAPRREHLTSFACALTDLAGPDTLRLAAGHRHTFRRCGPSLRALGIEVLSGGRRRNGADRVLIQQARALRARGVGRFLVVTNDHRFAKIAAFADLHVATLTEDYVSRELRAAARSITVLSRDETGWRPLRSATAGVIAGRASGAIATSLALGDDPPKVCERQSAASPGGREFWTPASVTPNS